MDDGKSMDLTSQIIIKPNEKQQCFETHGKDVTVVGFSGKHDHGSSKVKLKNIVDYKWEVKNYSGRLIAIHLNGKHMAYSIKVNNHGTAEGMVRVVDMQSGQRSLIKGIANEVLDLQFAYLESQIILGCIDEASLFIHRIDTVAEKLSVVLLLKIQDTLVGHDCKYDKLAWCPSVPQSKDDVDEYASQLLVWARGSQFQCYSINAVLDAYGTGTHKAADISDGSLKFQESSKTITHAIFSPDGTTLGVSSDDGSIDFYQIYLHLKDTSPRRLHHWKPHNGKVVTSFFFLDNHTEFTSNSTFWKHAITGAENNTEFKVWRCDTWTCIQTVTFKSLGDFPLFLKAEIDKTSSYLMISDTINRGLYALQIVKAIKEEDSGSEDGADGASKKDKVAEGGASINSIAYIKSITEFPMSSPILSFGIVDAALRKYKCGVTDAYMIEEMDDYDEENNSLYCVVIHMFLVQPKSVQECHVLYQPTLAIDTAMGSSLTLQGTAEVSDDELGAEQNEEEENETANFETCKSAEFNSILSPKPNNSLNLSGGGFGQKQPSQLNLMTPDSFHSPGKKEAVPEGVSEVVMSAIRMLAASTTSPDQKNLLNLVNNSGAQAKNFDEEMQHSFLRDLPVPQAEILASGGSSPSREVQKILALGKDDCLSEYFDDAEAGDDGEDVEDVAVVSDEAGHGNDDGKDDWPKVPNVQHISQMPSEILTDTNTKARNIEMKLDRMLELMYTQKAKIEELEGEIQHLKKTQINGHGADYKLLTANLEGNLSQLLDEYLQTIDRRHSVKTENLLAERTNETREALLHTFNQPFVNQITEKLSAILLVELKHQLLPHLSAKMESLVMEIGQKNDHLLRDTITKVCTSKHIVDTFAGASLRGAQNVFQATFTEILTKTLIPAFEKSTQEMFHQINSTFTIGIAKFVRQLEVYVMQQQPIQERSDETNKLVKGLPEQLKVSNDKMINSCTAQIMHDLSKDFKSLQMNLLKTIKECIKNEMQKSFEAQTANLEDSVLSVVRSQAQTPSIFDVQEKIKILLGQGAINKAFHQALIANDLNLVEFVIDKADYKTVFNPCPLEQTVLLSLIQQITADMSSYSELKHKYLSESVMNLNMKDIITKEHAPSVMKELHQNCQTYIAANPNSHLCGSLRMLLMAIQGLGFKVL